MSEEEENTQGQGEKIKTSKSAIGLFFSAITKPRTQLRVGLWGAVFLLALTCYIYAAGSLPIVFGVFPYPFAAIVLPIYIAGIAIRKREAFYFSFFVFLFWTVFFLFFVVLLQHAIFFLDPDLRSISFWDFEKRFLQMTWLWWLSIIFMYLGVAGRKNLLEARYSVELFSMKLRIKGKVLPLWEILTVFAIVGFLMGLLLPALAKVRTVDSRMQCGTNLFILGKAMRLYAEQNEGSYPVADQWCDLLIQCADVSEAQFRCPKDKKGKYSYAMNPNCEPNSAPGIVLLFETSGGWNQFGGPELVTYENHRGKGFNILYNDGHVEFVKPDEIGALKWKGEKGTEGFPRELVDFEAYKGNPLFGGTGEDTWDRNIRERGFILREGQLYKMWYTGYNDERSDMKYLGYATSEDGFEWKRYEGNPIFTERWVEDMFVVKNEGVYYMFAEGRGDVAHLLTSRDGVHWEDRGDLDIRYTTGERLSPGPYGTPTVLIEGDVWYLFYERDDLHVWLAKSTDLEVWTNVQDEPVLSPGPEDYDGKLIALDYIIRHKGRYYAYYHGIGRGPEGQEWGQWCSSVAVSADLVRWKKYPNNPIVIANSPILVDDGGVYRLYCMHPEVRVYFPR